MNRMYRLLCLMLCLCGTFPAAHAQPLATASAAEPAQPATEAPVVVFNRTVTVLRGSFLGVGPQDRARRTSATIREEINRPGANKVSIEAIPQGRVISIDGRLALILTPEDADPLQRETLDAAAAKAASMLEEVIRETAEARNFKAQLRSVTVLAAATAVLGGLLWLAIRIRSVLSVKLIRLAEVRAHTLVVGGEALIRRERLLDIVRWSLRTVFWSIVLLLAYEWFSVALGQFPYTRPWGDRLNQFLVEALLGVLGAIARAVPNLLIAAIVFLIARWIVGVLNSVFDRVQKRELQVSWLDPDTAAPTRRLAATGIWLFALAMAYPYLPGAQTEAFKGLSVLVGLMISLGASSLVGQGASGLILIYTRTMKVGEYVRIGDSEGTVTAIGMFSTRIRTGLGEELTLSNSQIVGSVTRNYSRAVQGVGYVVDTTVTIGYDTPWRQVEGLLVEAARRTPGVVENPQPRVFQTGLSDFYVEYRLVAQAIPSAPVPRAEVLTALHASIQDVFNEYGVQIMSPHYLGDPADAKIVAPENWHLAPARAEGEGAG